MAEHGFYHASRGYWQTIDDPADDVLESYPDGTEEIPLKPGEYFAWEHGAWVEHPPTPDEIREQMAPLNRYQFRAGFKAGGITTADINDDIAAVIDPDEREDYEIYWESTQTFKRLDDFVLLVSSGKTPEQTDKIWMDSLEL